MDLHDDDDVFYYRCFKNIFRIDFEFPFYNEGAKCNELLSWNVAFFAKYSVFILLLARS